MSHEDFKKIIWKRVALPGREVEFCTSQAML